MLAFGLILLAIGALLANVASALAFAVISLVLVVAGFAQGLYVGWPIGQALAAAVASFVCGQIGYVLGLGLRAFAVAKLRRGGAPTAPKATTQPEFEKSSARLNGGH